MSCRLRYVCFPYFNFFLSHQCLEVSGSSEISVSSKNPKILLLATYDTDMTQYGILMRKYDVSHWLQSFEYNFLAQIHDFQLQMGSEIPSPSWNFENFISSCLRHWWRPSTVYPSHIMMFLIDCDLLSSVFLLRSMIFNSNWVQKYHLQAGILKLSYLVSYTEITIFIFWDFSIF